MSKSKKFISFGFVVLMICSMFSGINVSAAGKTLQVNSSFDSNLKVGDTLTQTINFSNFVGVDTGIRAFKLVISFDKTKLNVIPDNEIGVLGDVKSTEVKCSFNTNGDQLSVLYADEAQFDNISGSYTFAGRSPIAPVDTQGDGIQVHFKVVGTGSTSVTVATGADISFIDCSYPSADASSSDVALRTVTVSNAMPLTNTFTLQSAASSAKNITAFSINGYIGTIDEALKSIKVIVPCGTNKTALTPVFIASDKATVKIGSVVQTSNATTNDFTNPVTYTVMAEDTSSKTYTVSVKDAAQFGTYKIVGNTLRGFAAVKDNISRTTVQMLLNSITLESGVTMKISDRLNVDVSTTLTKEITTGTKIELFINNGNIKVNEFKVMIRGDVNGDGKIDTGDYGKLKQCLLKKITFTDEYLIAAEINLIGIVDTGDYGKLKQFMLNKYVISQS